MCPPPQKKVWDRLVQPQHSGLTALFPIVLCISLICKNVELHSFSHQNMKKPIDRDGKNWGRSGGGGGFSFKASHENHDPLSA